jgi:hypothetical protein
MPVEIKIAQNEHATEWNNLVGKSVHGTLFHTWAWLRIAEMHTGMKLYPLIGMKDKEPIGIFPLFFQKKGPFKLIFSPPPRTVLFYLGPVILDYDRMKQEKRESIFIEFQKSVDVFLKDTLNPDYINISLAPNLKDPRPFLWSGYSLEPHYDYLIDFSNKTDNLLDSLAKKQRQNISHAKKRGISVDLGGRHEYEEILNLMDIRYAQQGKSVHSSKEYLMDVYDAYKDSFKVFVAKLNEEIVSGTIDFQYKGTQFSWIGTPKPKKRISPSPNDLIMYESVRFAQETGMKYYVTMNAAGNERLHSYYVSKFDPELDVHFSMKRSTVVMEFLEKGYSYFHSKL